MAQGILPVQQSKIDEQHIACPVCPSSDAYCTYEDGHGYCFSCNYFKPREGSSISDEVFTYEYLPWRGVTKETYQFFDTKSKVDASGRPVSLGFKYPNDSFKVRSLGEKAFHSVGDISKAGLFGRNKFAAGSHKYVTITEGELDALSLYQVLRSPVVSVRSSSSAKLDASIDRSWLNSFDRIYLAFDADEPGRMAAAEVAKLFDYNKVYDVRFPGGVRKDANDYVSNGEPDELRNIWYNSKKFLPDNIISSLADFAKELTTPAEWGVSYPFPTLTRMTYGLRTKETVLLTAQEGVGKTEVMHTILHHLLKETKDAIGAIFLEESKQRLLQAIAGIELKLPVHLPDCPCEPAEVISALNRVVSTDDRLHVYSHFDTDDAEAILDSIRFLVAARGCRWIMFDLISLAVASTRGEREEQALSYLSGRLSLMAKELDFGLVLVSHVNDYNQTRGSRMIGKNCHVRIDLTRDVTATDDRLRRTTLCTISKNRPANQTGFAGNLLFDPKSCTLSEDFGDVGSELLHNMLQDVQDSPPVQWQGTEDIPEASRSDKNEGNSPQRRKERLAEADNST